jgi:hypothetical protein
VWLELVSKEEEGSFYTWEGENGRWGEKGLPAASPDKHPDCPGKSGGEGPDRAGQSPGTSGERPASWARGRTAPDKVRPNLGH